MTEVDADFLKFGVDETQDEGDFDESDLVINEEDED